MRDDEEHIPDRPFVGTMFDVRLVDHTGQFDLSPEVYLEPTINLRPVQEFGDGDDSIEKSIPSALPTLAVASIPDMKGTDQVKSQIATLSSVDIRSETLRSLQETLAGHIDLHSVVRLAGGTLMVSKTDGKPRYIKVPSRNDNQDKYHNLILREITKPILPTSAERIEPVEEEMTPVAVEEATDARGIQETPAQITDALEKLRAEMPSPIEDYYSSGTPLYLQSQPPARRNTETVDSRAGNPQFNIRQSAKLQKTAKSPLASQSRLFGRFIWPSRRTTLTAIAVIAGIALLLAGVGGLVVREHVITQGASAVESLQAAKDSLEHFDFTAASENFTNAYEDFSKAGQSMQLLSGSIGAILGELPGGGAVKSARNLLSVGKLISEAGQSMSDVMKAVSKTGWVLNPQSNMRVLTGEILLPLRNALKLSSANISQAEELLADVNIEDLPEDKREQVGELRDKIPQFKELLSDAGEYASFFEKFVSPEGTKKYLLLFQNNSELRPTGGFPGTYGVVTFENGRLKDFFADDIYNIDGQLKDLIVPPVPIQHITPNWGMRDANWFIDFPTSAKKVAWFFPRESGYDIDGVITFNPTMMSNILKVVGPVSVPEFGVTVDADNFLTTVQSEVEYGDRDKTDNQPKKIVKDLAPLLLAKLYSAEKSKWLEVFNVVMAGLHRKDVLMYFKDSVMQQFAEGKGFTGEVKNPQSDFLMTTFSNVKGAKTDAVTDTAMELDTRVEGDSVVHTLSITRRHNGGSSKYGFYNRQNPSYVRMLVPKGAKLLRISGNSNPGYGPLLNYPKTDFARDPDVSSLEATAKRDSSGALVMEESGKTEFAFWMIVDPREIKTVEVEYEVPFVSSDPGTYELYVQKQPGLEVKDFQFGIERPEGLTVSDANLDLKLIDGVYTSHSTLEQDLPIRVKFK